MTVSIEYFSDVLCIWAYAGQIRIDQLKQEFPDDVNLRCRFTPIFAAAREHILTAWKDKGEFAGFNQHLQTVAKNWDHIDIHPDLWTKVIPESSQSAHIYLKAVQLLAEEKKITHEQDTTFNGRTLFEETLWQFRDAFFGQGRNISLASVQDEIALELNLPLKAIHELIDNGKAHAALHLDEEARRRYLVPGSPTLVLNEGRQLLYGNVGYRIIDANVRELLHNKLHGEASWC